MKKSILLALFLITFFSCHKENDSIFLNTVWEYRNIQERTSEIHTLSFNHATFKYHIKALIDDDIEYDIKQFSGVYKYTSSTITLSHYGEIWDLLRSGKQITTVEKETGILLVFNQIE